MKNPLKKSKDVDDIAIIGQDKIVAKMLHQLQYEDKIDDVGDFTKDGNDDILHYTDRAKVFGLPFLQLITLFEHKHKISELLAKNKDETKEDKEKRTDYSLKKVVLLFSNKKGNIRRTIIVEKQVNDEQ